MQLVIKEKNKLRINRLIDWLLHMVGYTIVFILVTSLFKSIYIDSNHLILWSIAIVLIIYALNKTIKPILVTLTIPITGITLGLFYPCINVFILLTSLFKSVYIDSNHLIIWSAITVILIYILNKTIKPVLITLTIPITGITLGLFYPCINVIILKLVDFLLGKHFQVKNLLVALFVAILLSITNFIMEQIMKNIIQKVKKNE